MLPVIIGGLVAAVGFAAGAIASHAAGEKDRQMTKHFNQVNADLINSRDALEKRYIELSDASKKQINDLQRKLAESELEKDALYLVIRLQSSLILLMQAIDKDPSIEVLFQFQQAVSQTNFVLGQIREELIPIPKGYFSRNLTRAKLKATQHGQTLTSEQKTALNKLMLTISDGSITCPSCHEQHPVMRNVTSVKCGNCNHLIDLVLFQSEIHWQTKAPLPEGVQNDIPQPISNSFVGVTSECPATQAALSVNTSNAYPNPFQEQVNLDQMALTVKPIVNGLFQATITHKNLETTAVGHTRDEAAQKALERMHRELETSSRTSYSKPLSSQARLIPVRKKKRVLPIELL